METSARPLLFVAMPIGVKPDPKHRERIDFDRIYRDAIKPAGERAGVQVIRADEETVGGIIHLSIYERLLLAEIVVADLTLGNPNVFYELGVRHSARPKSTILIYAKQQDLPFDVAMVRAIPYSLQGGALMPQEASRLTGVLTERLFDAIAESAQTDSPLFQLVHSYPGIALPHEYAESFKERVRYARAIRERIEEARRSRDDASALREIDELVRPMPLPELERHDLLVAVLLAYRDLKAYDRVIELAAQVVSEDRCPPVVQEQYAFSLNRRNRPGDRALALRVLRGVIDRHGESPETYGLMGSVHKDAYLECVAAGTGSTAQAHLDEAIACYRHGFESDPRDYYPGINAATLLFAKGDAAALAELQDLLPVVVFSVGRRGGLQSHDYWDIATVLEASVLGGDWATAGRASARLATLEAPRWQYQTTASNLTLIRRSREARGLNCDDLQCVLATIQECAQASRR